MGLNQTYLTDAEGVFDISGITPGKYKLVASLYDGGEYTTEKVAVDLTNDVDDLHILLRHSLLLNGQISVEGNATPDLSNVRVSLLPAESGEILTPTDLPIAGAGLHYPVSPPCLFSALQGMLPL